MIENTTMYGAVESCGEVSASVVLTTGPTRTVTFASSDVATAMRERVGKKVRMDCRAVWVASSPDADGIVTYSNPEIHVTACYPFDPVGVVEAFDELREAVGGAFDGVDAEAYVAEMRGR